ncbi:hypothetical protein L0U85_02840 [Glycomyces sp. L485]|uniref:hypothetical protein n=1 Tax=Glycomyces sp. L485 TaxID=2909235 RepID=UPI001F4AEA74|nr:hypothetical protein [Glycomyces sp. L485]MCH7229800.1 hypothetical protein [Glycomyces sp. L485]
MTGAMAVLEEADSEPVGHTSTGGILLDRHCEINAVLCGGDQVARGSTPCGSAAGQ